MKAPAFRTCGEPPDTLPRTLSATESRTAVGDTRSRSAMAVNCLSSAASSCSVEHASRSRSRNCFWSNSADANADEATRRTSTSSSVSRPQVLPPHTQPWDLRPLRRRCPAGFSSDLTDQPHQGRPSRATDLHHHAHEDRDNFHRRGVHNTALLNQPCTKLTDDLVGILRPVDLMEQRRQVSGTAACVIESRPRDTLESVSHIHLRNRTRFPVRQQSTKIRCPNRDPLCRNSTPDRRRSRTQPTPDEK